MDKPDKKNNLRSRQYDEFLKDKPNREGISQGHKSYLGLNAPEGYFAKSKQDILSLVADSKKAESRPTFTLNPMIRWAVAASIAILIGAGAFFLYQNSTSESHKQITEGHQSFDENEDNVVDDPLIASLFIDDSSLDQFVDEYLMNTIFEDVVYLDAEDMIINSLFMEEHELDDYITDYLLEEMVF